MKDQKGQFVILLNLQPASGWIWQPSKHDKNELWRNIDVKNDTRMMGKNECLRNYIMYSWD